MDFDLVVKENKILKFSGQWMELSSIILSKVTQTQKDKKSADSSLQCICI